MNIARLLLGVLVASSLGACRVAPVQLESNDASPPAWSYRLDPYVWIPSLKGDVPDGDGDPVDVDLIGVDDLEYAFMAGLEARGPEADWSLLLDSVYVRFDDERRALDTEVDARMFEFGGVYAPAAWDFELLAALRYWRVGVDFDLLSAASRAQEESWVDPVLGARATWPLSANWSLHGRADLGGFGLETDWTYQARLEAHWSFSERGELLVGYRYLDVEFDDFELGVTLAGPALGLRWSF